MAGLAIDDAAWAGTWRTRAVGDKALLSLGLVLVALLLPPWPASPLVALTSVIVLVGPARVPVSLVLRALRGPLAFIVVSGLSVAVTVGAQEATQGGAGPSAYWRWGPLAVTPESLAAAAGLTAHAVAGTLAVLVLASTTPMVDLLASARRVRVPDACVEIAALTYRLLFVLLDSVRSIREAQSGRLGYHGRRAALRSAGMLTAAALTRSWDRARRMEEGLAGRGYESALLTLPREQRRSAGFLVASMLLLVSLVVLSLATSAGVGGP
ncbi:cobalt ECF transporter T component CbiQ [Arsenicicoccus cauae]|uniref:Cobalt ECF transporter T component CbiQ n=1 Tax=Arsenicicoccus cauae TaxID=2663847 RepID=A0A6I3I4X3_9MICO|nr:cobalt ECF transporter T component CbiQ [Arsenicicoccus cauae]MTB71204.1 cobalt ECF transporter T component CbiQ [Arsenicicoccus cauae]